jgi:hypothetical protein
MYPGCHRYVRLPAKRFLCRLHKAVREAEERKEKQLKEPA